MTENWKHQVRLTLEPDYAALARSDPGNAALDPLRTILEAHNAHLKCQFDAFSDYVAEAERRGPENFPLYRWTKATIEKPEKEAKYIKSFTIYADGQEVYDKPVADALAAAIEPLIGGDIVSAMTRHDTNPANNPQPPKRYRTP